MLSKDTVDKIRIESPCAEVWEKMVGTDDVRFCSHCNLNVHNLSRLNRKQALRLVARAGGRLCLRYIPLPDGSPQTRELSRRLYHIGRRASRLAAGAFSATLSVTAAAGTVSPDPRSFATLSHVESEQSFFSRTSSSSTAVLRGFIYDPNGAVIPGALVSLSSGQTNVSLSTTTNGEGEYRFADLEAGVYDVRVEANGFAAGVVTGIPVRSDSENVINQTLGIAPIESEVTVQPAEEIALAGGVAIPLPTEPLVLAAQKDDLEALKQLLVGRSNINMRDARTDSTALEHAVMNSNREMLQALLWAGADVNARDKSGRTPLMLLGENITSDIVWDLINAGAKVNLHDNDGDTALMEAAACNNLEVLKVLLDAGAKVNARNNERRTPLMNAAEQGFVNNVKTLILAGAEIDARDVEGQTAWTLAVQGDYKPVLRLLRAYGADETPAPEKNEKAQETP